MLSQLDKPACRVPGITPLAPDMSDDVAELESVCFPHHAWSPAQYLAAMEAGTCWGRACYLELDGTLTLAGYLAVSSVLDEMEILNVAVRSEFRMRGIASKMLAEILQEAVERRIVSCLLEVREGNVPARTLYAHAGFLPVGQRRQYYSDNGENAVVMALDLTGRI